MHSRFSQTGLGGFSMLVTNYDLSQQGRFLLLFSPGGYLAWLDLQNFCLHVSVTAVIRSKCINF